MLHFFQKLSDQIGHRYIYQHAYIYMNICTHVYVNIVLSSILSTVRVVSMRGDNCSKDLFWKGHVILL